eukprot:IDg11886t1
MARNSAMLCARYASNGRHRDGQGVVHWSADCCFCGPLIPSRFEAAVSHHPPAMNTSKTRCWLIHIIYSFATRLIACHT